MVDTSKMPWGRFFPSDWLGGTRGMTAAETGIYITLLMTMYERGKPLPEDNARLARLCGASNSVFKSTLESLIEQGKLERSEDGIWNNRVGRELFYTLEKSSVARQSANARWSEKSNKNNGGDDANALPTHSERNANQKPDTRYNKSNTNVLPKKTKKACRLPEDFKPDFSIAYDEGFSQEEAQRLFASFKDYWVAKSGKDATKLDWQATWRNWVRSDYNQKFKGNRNAGNRNNQQQQQSFADGFKSAIAERFNLDGFSDNTGFEPESRTARQSLGLEVRTSPKASRESENPSYRQSWKEIDV